MSADASASSDPQGQTLSYAFDFGDGATVPASTTATAAHTYTAAGSYTLTVTVTNTLWAHRDRPEERHRLGASPADQPPTASLTVTPSSGTAPLQVSADASASQRPTGTDALLCLRLR